MERIGRYEVLGELARGGMGAVYRGRDPADGRQVAIKLMLAPERSWKRFRQEAQALAKVDHPGVVRVLEHDVASQRPYLVMELIEGESLAARIRRGGPLAAPQATELAIKLCAAVAACHRAGVLHRDLKPDNVLLTVGDAVKLTDFGLVLDTDPDLGSSRLTAEGNPLGSPTYWAPEQAGGKLDQISERTDVYGLGGTLFTMLTGTEPHQGETLIKLLSSVREPKPPPSSLNPEVPAWLDRVVLRALAPDPQARFAGVDELSAALASGLNRRSGSRGLFLALAGVAGLFALGLGAAWSSAAVAPAPAPRSDPAIPASSSVADTPRETADDLFARGSELAKAKRWAEARDRFRAAIELDPSLHRAHGGLAVACYELDDLQASLDAVNHALSLEPDYPPGYQLRATLWLKLGDPARAVEDAEAWARLHPDDPESFFVMGLAHGANANSAGAAWALERARAAGSTREGLDVQLGRYYGLAHQYERAILAFERALADDPQSAEARQLLEKANTDRDALYRRLDDLAERGQQALNEERWVDAERLFSEMLALRPRLARVLLNRSKARNMLGNPRGGLADCEAALELDSESPTAYLNRGACLAALNQLERAIADFERALELDPTLEGAQRNLGLARTALRQQRERR